MSPTAGPLRFVLFGHPVAHSLSPRLHRAAFEALGLAATYEAIDVSPGEFDRSLRAEVERGLAGANVTAPFKEEARAAASRLTVAVERAGVANCLRPSVEGLEAHNTDGEGFLDFLAEAGLAVDGRAVVLLGGGGAAAGLAPALGAAGARVRAVARRPAAARRHPGLAALDRLSWESAEAARALGEAALVVNCTPLGGSPGDALPCPPSALAPGAAVVDLRYVPRRTPWLEACAERGLVAYDGLGLLVHQAARSLAYWLEREPPLERLREAVAWKAVPHRPEAPA